MNSTIQDSCNATTNIGSSSSIQTLLMSLIGAFPILGMLVGGGQNGGGGGTLFLTGVLLLVTNYSMAYIMWYLTYFYTWIRGKFFFSVVIKSEDEIYSWVFEFINEAQFAKKASELSAHSAWNSKGTATPWQPQVNPYSDAQESKRPLLYYVPYYGSWFFFHKKFPVFITRSQINTQQPPVYNYRNQNQTGINIQYEVIRISTIGFFPTRTINFLKNYVNDCMEKSYSKNESTTWIYSPVVGYNMVWKRTMARSVRSFESVVLDRRIKEEIKEDVELFQSSRTWYNERGIPYRRGYLLHGPPGTGKSSYISALAGKLKMSIAVLSLNLAMMDDAKIAKLIDDTPRNSLLVIEDVDVALVEKKKEHGVITLSGLLNALDGIATAEGRILFMTTNHIENLKSSLLRPGRVDMKVFFGYASGDQIAELWANFYAKNKKDEEKNKRMLEIGEILRKKIPEKFVTCAELQGFYLLHRFKEEKILDDLDRFLEDIKIDREKQKKEEEEKKKKEIEKKKEKKKELQSQIQKLNVPNSPSSPADLFKGDLGAFFKDQVLKHSSKKKKEEEEEGEKEEKKKKEEVGDQEKKKE